MSRVDKMVREVVDGLGPRVKSAPTFAGTPFRGTVQGAFRSSLGYCKVTVLRDDSNREETFHAHDLCREDLNVG